MFFFSHNSKIFSNETVKVDRSKIPKPYSCKICSKKFAQRHRLRYHEKAHDDPFYCKECDRTFEIHSLYQIHMQRHAGTLKYKCEICGRSFGQESILNNHLKRHSSILIAFCSECGKGYTTKDGLRYHMKSHSAKQKFFCMYCKEGFFYKSKCKEHEANHLKGIDTNTVLKYCEECKHDIPISKYKNHIRKHSKYECKLCGASFSMLKLCKEHEKTHANEQFKITPSSTTECKNNSVSDSIVNLKQNKIAVNLNHKINDYTFDNHSNNINLSNHTTFTTIAHILPSCSSTEPVQIHEQPRTINKLQPYGISYTTLYTNIPEYSIVNNENIVH